MDLNFANENLVDQGVLQDYSFDECYGDKDNDFECRIQKYNPAILGKNGVEAIKADFVLYIERTDYGGIIDRVESNTKTGEIVLSGRSWHGVLNSFVIEPPENNMYRVYDGPANDVLAQIIEDIGMTSLFVVDTDTEDDIEISSFQVRYEKAYDCIMRMLKEQNGKLICYYLDGKVHLRAVLLVNYALNEEFDSSQVPFKVGYTYNNVNHLICLGQGDGADRAVIHLFTDDSGAIQPYSLIDNPLEDSEYILDKSQQLMTGKDEICEIYDYPNAEITTNYKKIPAKPNNWNGTYYNYYQRKANSTGYENIPRVYADEMWLTEAKYGGAPSNWYVSTGYQNYYYKSGNEYKKVEELTDAQASWILLSAAPNDWNNAYNSYYERTGENNEYTKVNGVSKDYHYRCPSKPDDWVRSWGNYFKRVQTGTGYAYESWPSKTDYEWNKHLKKPSDWNSNYGSYWFLQKVTKTVNKKKFKKGKYYTVSDGISAGIIKKQENKDYPKWKKNTYYNRVTKYYATAYEQGKVYYRETKTEPPEFEANRYYKKDGTPTWRAGTYYELQKDVEQIPTFTYGQYFYAVQDRLANLVKGGIKKLQSLCDTSSLDISLELESSYDVGDIVGSMDDVTKIEVNKPILRKIIKIKKDILSVEYEVD